LDIVNHLAAFNKISLDFSRTSHSLQNNKTFKVTLRLGNKQHSAEGPRIKEAKQAAARCALWETSYQHPPPPRKKQDIHLGKSDLSTLEMPCDVGQSVGGSDGEKALPEHQELH
jgi:hypothetical protein